jgi:hypothetical protein
MAACTIASAPSASIMPASLVASARRIESKIVALRRKAGS